MAAGRRTKREAEKALAELIVRRDREGLVRANQTFGQATAKCREAKEQTGAPSSLLRYHIALRTHLLPRFDDVQLRVRGRERSPAARRIGRRV